MPYVTDGPKGKCWVAANGANFGLMNGIGSAGREYVPGQIHRSDRMASTGLYDDGKKAIRRLIESWAIANRGYRSCIYEVQRTTTDEDITRNGFHCCRLKPKAYSPMLNKVGLVTRIYSPGTDDAGLITVRDTMPAADAR